MSKHSQEKILKAYADNTELNIFISEEGSDKWIRTNPKALMDHPECDFFACLPQHNESGQCLHWLNGGKSQLEYIHDSNPTWDNIDNDAMEWSIGHVFMDDGLKIRIKPRKEKRWIGVNSKTGVTTHLKESREDLEKRIDGYSSYQAIEIEVEV